MTYRYMKNERTLPLWAALGAPLVGVPLMVGLLAIATPKAETPADEPVPAAVTEPVGSDVDRPATGDSLAELEWELGLG